MPKGICETCGCAYNTPCEGGCAWTDNTETLCTSCWHKRYKQQLIDAGVDEEFAEEWLQAGMGEYDYEEEPEDYADSEMSYWEQ